MQPAQPEHKVLKVIRALQVRTARWRVQRDRKVLLVLPAQLERMELTERTVPRELLASLVRQD